MVHDPPRAYDTADTINKETTMATTVTESDTVKDTDAPPIRPFHVDISDEALENLRRRITATQWPEKETVADSSQGVPLATMRELARYWATDYDWRTVEARLNALPQFIT